MTRQYIVDAFSDRVFAGNPAAVCVLNDWPSETWMQNVAAENNLSETAYIVKGGDTYGLRWFTPKTEVDLCGHATLASAFVVTTFLEPQRNEVLFETKSGMINVSRDEDVLWMDFSAGVQEEIPVTDEMENAFGVRPVKAFLGLDLVCVFPDADTVQKLVPDMNRVAKLPGRIQNATARGRDADFVSRSFAPKLGIPEDPVCGSAHCLLAAYWADELGKDTLEAWQASKRGGRLLCRVTGDGRVQIGGSAALFAVCDIEPQGLPVTRT